jgi:hypothetical protein
MIFPATPEQYEEMKSVFNKILSEEDVDNWKCRRCGHCEGECLCEEND